MFLTFLVLSRVVLFWSRTSVMRLTYSIERRPQITAVIFNDMCFIPPWWHGALIPAGVRMGPPWLKPCRRLVLWHWGQRVCWDLSRSQTLTPWQDIFAGILTKVVIWVAWWQTAVSPVCQQWSYCSLAQGHQYIDGSVQERRNSIANALELHLSHTKPSLCASVNCLNTRLWYLQCISIGDIKILQ